ncbi:MAG: ABC transporter ATP-binding protein [Magnetococcales bacterium]|nr:ABC transporter ATP-binding protein [Magnetococcales bacterium]NGZ29460.1 ABC transporter ATP-binding protein [Magnetococcales bacterium]
MSDIMIEVKDLTRYYGPARALDRINLQVRRGEVMGFLGPNGAGKTTTMRILAGLLAPTEGTVRVAGLDMLENPEEAKARIGFLPETPPIYDEMTVREYLSYLATLRKVPSGQLAAAVDRAMERCGLTQVAERLLRNLSKGYRQRAGIAQAIVHSPDVVILDEPTVGLDPIQVREIRELIRELGGEHSVLLSTHILPEVRMTCNRVAVISEGKIVAEDSLDGLMNLTGERPVYKVRWRNGPSAQTIGAIAGIANVSDEGGGVWRLTPAEGADPLPEVLRLSVEGGWDLREVTSDSHSLEDVFLRLTTRESEGEGNREGEG